MKAVSSTFRLQESLFRLPQLPLGLPQFFMQQGQKQIQRMFNGLGFIGLATFGEFERED